MANRRVGNVYIIDSAGTLDLAQWKIQSVAFYSTDTTGELVIVDFDGLSTTTSELIHIRNNQNQPFMLPMYLGGVNFQNRLRIQTMTAGTAWFYLA